MRLLIFFIPLTISLVLFQPSTFGQADSEIKMLKRQLEEGFIELEKGASDQAIAVGKEALLKAKNLRADSLAGVACQLVGQGYYYKKEYQEALQYLKEGLLFCAEGAKPLLRAQLLYRSGVCMIYLGNNQVAIDSAFLPIIAQKEVLLSVNPKVVYNAYVGQGSAYRRNGVLDSCENAYLEALQLKESFNIKSTNIFYNLRQVYEDMGKYEAALKYALLTLQADEASQDSAYLALDYSMLGNLYSMTGNLEKAKKHAEISIDIIEKVQSPIDPALVYGNMARIQKMEGAFQEAIVTLERALKMETDPYGTSILNVSLGECYYHVGKMELAEKFLLSGIAEQKKRNKNTRYVESTRILAVIYQVWGKHEKAAYYYQEAAKNIESSQSIEEQADFYHTYSGFMETQGRYKEAFDAYKTYKSLQDSLFSQQSQARFQELSIAYEAQELKNELLQKETDLLKAQQLLSWLVMIAFLLLSISILFGGRQLYRNVQSRKKITAFLEEIHNNFKHLKATFQELEAFIRPSGQPPYNDPQKLKAVVNPAVSSIFKDDFLDLNYDVLKLKNNFDRFKTQLSLFENVSTQEKEALAQSIENLKAIQYSMAHDLKGPLFRLKTLLPNLFTESGAYPPILLKREVMQSVVEIEDLINALTLILEIDQKEEFFSEFDLATLIQSIINEQAGSIAQTGAMIKYNGLPKLYSDRYLMKIVWTNLISNALKFSSYNQKPDIRISAVSKGDTWELSIKDNGVGWKKGEERKLFQAFSQISDTHSLRHGSGVGLFITQKIIRILKGDIRAVRQNRGAIFTIILPK
ncbi:MAG: hypothetical protein H6573_00120 [Lewinellaceae bacterium]|nr:hypothetical protein [Phaeodactylibacter sp.]MCB9345901.1 hypothetical protein [Lewinellaceae bacterium]